MRTTLDIDDEVLAAVKEVARRERVTAGQVVSRCIRQVFTGSLAEIESTDMERSKASDITGFHPFPARGKLVANDEVNRIREAEGV